MNPSPDRSNHALVLNALDLALDENSSSFVMLFAQAGFGKTWLALNLHAQKKRSVVLLSPLRSILLELNDTLSSQGLSESVIYFEKGSDTKRFSGEIADSNNPKLILTTPELLNDEILQLLENKKYILILDEIHLYFYWGCTFRDRLWNFLLTALSTTLPILTMSATFAQELEPQIQELVTSSTRNAITFNLGKGVQYNPKKEYFFPAGLDRDLPYLLHWHLKKELAPILVFCPYREQVDELSILLKKFNLRVLACKGGESVEFYKVLREIPDPQIIVATSVLSHGVNLPEIRAIFLLYTEKNSDIRQQMIGRGGRKGSDFFVYELNPAFYSIGARLKSYWRLLAIFYWEYLTYGLAIRWDCFIKNALSGEAFALQGPLAKRPENQSHPLWRPGWWKKPARQYR